MLLVIKSLFPFGVPLEDELAVYIFQTDEDKVERPLRGYGFLVNGNMRKNIPLLKSEQKVFNDMLDTGKMILKDNSYQLFMIINQGEMTDETYS